MVIYYLDVLTRKTKFLKKKERKRNEYAAKIFRFKSQGLVFNRTKC